MQKKLATILLNWNTEKDTITCVRSLMQLKLSGIEQSIYIIDNGSQSSSVQAIRDACPDVHLVSLDENRGFTGANNIGIQQALEDGNTFFWILNSDTIVHENAAQALIDSFTDVKIGIAGSKIYFMKGMEYHATRYRKDELGKVVWYAGGLIDWNNVYGSHRGVDEVDQGQFDTTEDTDFVTGCSMMVSKACFETIGLFDNRYFAFLEDMDLCLRARQHHFRTVYVPQSVVWHKNASATGGPGNQLHTYYMTRNRILFARQYASLRTKAAIVRESFRLAVYGTTFQRLAVIDAGLSRYGKISTQHV